MALATDIPGANIPADTLAAVQRAGELLASAGLNPEAGLDLIVQATRFILPASALGLPVVAFPMTLANGAPTGIQFYADLWREDLCLEVAEIIEQGVGTIVPIMPTA